MNWWINQEPPDARHDDGRKPEIGRRSEGFVFSLNLILFKSGGINSCSPASFIIQTQPVRRCSAFQISGKHPSRFFCH